MDLGLKGKIALITGGGTGIGRAIAVALAREGVDVAIASRNPDPVVVAEIEALGVRALRLSVDVSQESEVVKMVAQTIEAFGHLDLFVNNSGHHWHEPATKLTTENWIKTLNTNLSACLWACREVARHMIARRQGSILIVGSTIVFNPGYQESAYRITKTGNKAYAETLAIELAPFGIRVNVLTPGVFLTRLASTNLDAVLADPVRKERFLSTIPMRRLGESEECGAAAALLLSDKVSSYTTGAEIVIDGGFKLRPLTLVTEDEIAQMNL